MAWERIAVHTSEMRRTYPMVVAFALTALTALILFATPVVAHETRQRIGTLGGHGPR